MDAIDRAIINKLQGAFPLCEEPYVEAAKTLGISSEELIRRIADLLAKGTLTRFGPMYHAERLGGALTLAAMRIPSDDVERVAMLINAFPEVAHNYERDHEFNLWFVIATETPERIRMVIEQIQRETGYPVYDMPKVDEYFVGLRFEV